MSSRNDGVRHLLAWMFALAAVAADCQSLAAELLVARCRATFGIDAFDVRSWQEHFAAFPWTTVSMVWMCAAPAHAASSFRWTRVGTRLLLMVAAMWPACELARLAATLVQWSWTTTAYGFTMLVTSMAAVEAVNGFTQLRLRLATSWRLLSYY